jgi:hypothetical protein
MRDYPHHMKKLTRRVIRSERRLEREDETRVDQLPNPPQPTPRPHSQLRKQQKTKMREERHAHIPSDLTPEQRARKMRNRVPIFDRFGKRAPSTKAPRK